MAWKVIGFMEGRDRTTGFKAVFGPLPVKFWQKSAGDKKHRVSKVPNHLSQKPVFDKTDLQRKGIEYARWLAARDGIALPEGRAGALFGHVMLDTGKVQDRICAVMFYASHSRDHVRVDIPNWNWVPREPVEMVDGDQLALAA